MSCVYVYDYAFLMYNNFVRFRSRNENKLAVANYFHNFYESLAETVKKLFAVVFLRSKLRCFLC